MKIDYIEQLIVELTASNLSSLELVTPTSAITLVRPRDNKVLDAVIGEAKTDALETGSGFESAATAILCGYFYSEHPASTAGAVPPGQPISIGDVIGALEVGGTIAPIRANQTGIAGDYLIPNGSFVEYGTPLLALN